MTVKRIAYKDLKEGQIVSGEGVAHRILKKSLHRGKAFVMYSHNDLLSIRPEIRLYHCTDTGWSGFNEYAMSLEDVETKHLEEELKRRKKEAKKK